MPHYELRLPITAPDDDTARRLAHSWTQTLVPYGLPTDQARLVQVSLPAEEPTTPKEA